MLATPYWYIAGQGCKLRVKNASYMIFTYTFLVYIFFVDSHQKICVYIILFLILMKYQQNIIHSETRIGDKKLSVETVDMIPDRCNHKNSS